MVRLIVQIRRQGIDLFALCLVQAVHVSVFDVLFQLHRGHRPIAQIL